MTLRKKLLIAGSAAGAVAIAAIAYFLLPSYLFSRAVEHSMQQQALLLEGATPLFDTVIAKRLVVGDSLEHAKKVLTDAGQEFTVETDPTLPRRLQSNIPVGRGAGFLVQLDLDSKDRISKVDITKFYEGP
jgi:hypothetical protein